MKLLLVRLLICGLLGALTTIPVAWYLAITTVVRAPQRSPAYGVTLREGGYRDERSGRVWWCQVMQRPGLTVVLWYPLPGMTLHEDGTMSGNPSYDWVMQFGLPEPYWLKLEPQLIPSWASPPPGAPVAGYQAISARGWPARAMHYTISYGATQTQQGGMRVPRPLDRLGRGRFLPLRICPAGFLIDTVVYGLVFLAVIELMLLARGSSRHHHRRCVACGYDLSGAVDNRCSECGRIGPSPMPDRQARRGEGGGVGRR